MKLNEVATFSDNVAEMTQFYRDLLGEEPTHQDEGVATFEIDGLTVLIHQTYDPGEGELPCEDHLGFGVSGLEEKVEELVARGVELVAGPRDYPWGRSAYVRAPDGQLIELSDAGDESHGH